MYRKEQMCAHMSAEIGRMCMGCMLELYVQLLVKLLLLPLRQRASSLTVLVAMMKAPCSM